MMAQVKLNVGDKVKYVGTENHPEFNNGIIDFDHIGNDQDSVMVSWSNKNGESLWTDVYSLDELELIKGDDNDGRIS